MNIIHGDLIEMALDGKFDVIVHGCNCFCAMGAGIAARIKEVFPEAYLVDSRTKYGDYKKMGTITTAISFIKKCQKPITIINAYTQFTYKGIPGLTDRLKLDYLALRQCLHAVSKMYADSVIGMPQVGCGLAGGKWSKVKKIIEEEFNGLDYTVVMYDKKDEK